MLKKLPKNLLFLILLLFAVLKGNTQYAASHYIAQSPWQYLSNANEFFLTAESATKVTINFRESDTAFLTIRILTSAAPDGDRFVGSPWLLNSNPFNSIQNDIRSVVKNTGGKVSINPIGAASNEADEIDGNTVGSTFYHLINFQNKDIGNDENITVASRKKMIAGVQGSGGLTMQGFFPSIKLRLSDREKNTYKLFFTIIMHNDEVAV